MRRYFSVSPPLLYQIFITLMLMLMVFPVERTIEFPFNLAGILFLSGGMFMAVKAKKHFRKTNTPVSPEAIPQKLHQSGMFKYTRNPMYLGIVTGLTGIAILTGLMINLIFPLIYSIIMDRVFIKSEEGKLKEKFGKEFLQYKQKTRRWIYTTVSKMI